MKFLIVEPSPLLILILLGPKYSPDVHISSLALYQLNYPGSIDGAGLNLKSNVSTKAL